MSERKPIYMDLANIGEFKDMPGDRFPWSVVDAPSPDVLYWHDGDVRPLAEWQRLAVPAAWRVWRREQEAQRIRVIVERRSARRLRRQALR